MSLRWRYMGDYPAEFINRIYKTKLSPFSSDYKIISKIQESWPGVDVDVIYEQQLKPVIVLVFETQEDLLAFKLKYGDNYV